MCKLCLQSFRRRNGSHSSIARNNFRGIRASTGVSGCTTLHRVPLRLLRPLQPMRPRSNKVHFGTIPCLVFLRIMFIFSTHVAHLIIRKCPGTGAVACAFFRRSEWVKRRLSSGLMKIIIHVAIFLRHEKLVVTHVGSITHKLLNSLPFQRCLWKKL